MMDGKLTEQESNLVTEHLESLVEGLGVTKTTYWLAGGCIASILQGEEPKDYDLYTNGYAGALKEELLKNPLKNPLVKLEAETKNALTFSYQNKIIQVMKEDLVSYNLDSSDIKNKVNLEKEVKDLLL